MLINSPGLGRVLNSFITDLRMVEPVLSKEEPEMISPVMKTKSQDTELPEDPISALPMFIKLQSPPPFDIQKHMAFIRSQLPKDQLKVLDAALEAEPHLFEKIDAADNYLDCSAEESFTLEPFSALLMAAKTAGKDFILARVTTLDPMTQPHPQLFHSYYSGQHLNKILFRTQPEEGLLHRMKSRNPLNNLLIVGDVDYFVVNLSGRMPPTPAGAPYGPAPAQQKPKEGLLVVKGSEQVNVVPFENAAEFTSPRPQPLSLALNRSNSSLNRLAASPSLNALLADAREPAILYTAHPFATDDDFLMRADVREFFKASSVNPDDYLLFTLYRANGAEPATAAPNLAHLPALASHSAPLADAEPPRRRVRSWKNCWGFFYAPSPSLARVKTGIISRAAFKYVFVLYLLGCVAALIFLVPIYMIYYAALGMFFFILVVAVFLVECNPDPEGEPQRWNIFTHRRRIQQHQENARISANITSSHSVIDINANNSCSAV